MHLFWAFVILLIFLLVFVIAVRNRLLAWGWNFALIAIILYAALFKMTGIARDAWLFSTIENVHGDVEIAYSTVIKKQFIVLLVKTEPGVAPYYLRIEYNKGLEDELDKAKMQAERDQTALLANADVLSKWIMHVGKETKENKNGQPGGETAHGGIQGTASKSGEPYGGEMMFYPKPVEPDPLKDFRTTIETAPVSPPAALSPDAPPPENAVK